MAFVKNRDRFWRKKAVSNLWTFPTLLKYLHHIPSSSTNFFHFHRFGTTVRRTLSSALRHGIILQLIGWFHPSQQLSKRIITGMNGICRSAEAWYNAAEHGAYCISTLTYAPCTGRKENCCRIFINLYNQSKQNNIFVAICWRLWRG